MLLMALLAFLWTFLCSCEPILKSGDMETLSEPQSKWLQIFKVIVMCPYPAIHSAVSKDRLRCTHLLSALEKVFSSRCLQKWKELGDITEKEPETETWDGQGLCVCRSSVSRAVWSSTVLWLSVVLECSLPALASTVPWSSLSTSRWLVWLGNGIYFTGLTACDWWLLCGTTSHLCHTSLPSPETFIGTPPPSHKLLSLDENLHCDCLCICCVSGPQPIVPVIGNTMSGPVQSWHKTWN